ncbi:hypothetical protein [Ciceribacter thiooxidans]|uniref:Uncharacterized protein n=1 Tax=Ciceribacter thiooxidans TaxID=1969821 RepID=A0ABV7I295_9HYPH|nr:hypothetical protein [Ciceribacter thiooxidans]
MTPSPLTIGLGVLPLYYFGTVDYGRTTGILSGVRMVLSAAAPVSIVFVSERASAGAAILFLLGAAGTAAETMALLSRLAPPTREEPGS